ncbi:transporter substrate-binding domain-containing protein [Desulfovibrio psychrotolerans]|uniref:histidine kinase n=1 Tax=Desulfovibrio psychrotolerans TaxID=415242 RepID=A0A7J0BZ25_9BACT|nr:transporter substrate-binding domain-containing protein [Desulfovibrio psychrotolerans]GFM38445.1 hypothetical protein DSM19430T_31290 [Desulfovibrio psychrotolerans]
MRTLLIIFACTLLLGSGVYASPAQSAEDDNLIHIRGDYNYPPYDFLDNGVPSGFSVDIVRAVARVMNLNIRIDLGPWTEVRSQIEQGEIDALTGMYYSPERERLVDFCTPHIIANHALFVRKGSPIASLDDLAGKTIVVQQGDIMHDYARLNLPDVTIVTVTSQNEALDALASGGCDAALLGTLQALHIIHRRKLDGLETVGPPMEPRRFCIVVRKGDEVLRATFNEGLNIIKNSGEYERIHDKWFGVYERESITRTLMLYAMYAGIPIALLLCGFLLWTWSLRRAVQQKTADLRQSRERFRTLVESSPLGMALIARNGNVLLVNTEFTRMLGYTHGDVPHMDEWWKKALPDPGYRRQGRMLWDAALRRAGNALPSNTTVREWEVACKNGEIRFVEFRVKPIGNEILAILTDTTERKRTEELLVQSEKMLSVGGLAAGMAHEINNPLGGILQGVQNISRRLYGDIEANRKAAEEAGCSLEAIREYMRLRRMDRMLEGIRECGQRAAKIVSNMLNFSRKSESHHAPHRLPDIVERAIRLAESDYDVLNRFDFRSLIITRDFPPDLPEVHCSETEMVQVFFNLLRNAAQAIAEQRIEQTTNRATNRASERTSERPTERADRTEQGRITIAARQEGDSLAVMVRDNGPGMDGETRRRIFEPFFTTKPPGKGTGLGLSVCYLIVHRNHRGDISVESVPGKGTAFHLRLPLNHTDVASLTHPED